MTDDLIAYLMDDLSPERRAEVDAKLETDVVWRWELQRLRECMAASGDIESCAESSPASLDALEASHVDASPVDVEPPVDLVQKTCCFVENSASGKFKVEKRRCGKQKAAFSAETCQSGGRSWSLADVTVGAGVLLILAALVMPAVQHSRDAARNSVCDNNLRGTYLALDNFQGRHDGALPPLAASDPAVMLYIDLIDAGYMTKSDAMQVMTCPNSPQAERLAQCGVTRRIPSREELSSLSAREMATAIGEMYVSYALLLGFRDDKGNYQQPTLTGDTDVPLIADAPAVTPTGFQPVNHGFSQNMLTKAGSVNHFAPQVLSCQDPQLRKLYLNDNGEQSAGCNADDAVLALPHVSPIGPINLALPTTRHASKFFVLELRLNVPQGKQ